MNAASVPRHGLWRPRMWLGFLWGFAEGTLFFIIPDVLITWAALANARTGSKILIAALAGSCTAGAVMYSWALAQPDQSRRIVASVPFVRERMFAKVEQDYREHGLTGMLYGPGSGVPYKVYAVEAPPLGQPWLFFLLTIPARLERLVVTWLVSTAIGHIFRTWIDGHPRLVRAAFTVLWIGIYIGYWSQL